MYLIYVKILTRSLELGIESVTFRRSQIWNLSLILLKLKYSNKKLRNKKVKHVNVNYAKLNSISGIYLNKIILEPMTGLIVF